MAKESGEHRGNTKPSAVVQPEDGKVDLLQRNDQLEKELVHAQEDMQGLNEALKTSKEELQSTNVEIISLKQQLREKQEQLNAIGDNWEAIVSTIKEPLLVLDKNLRIKFANQSFYKRFNSTEQEAKDRLFYEIQDFRWDNKKLLELLEQMLPQKNRLEDFEMILDERIIVLNAREIWSHKNTEPSILLSIKDVTDSRMAKKLKTSEAKLNDFFMQAPAMFAILKGPEHVFEFSNAAYIELIGDRNPIGKKVSEVLPEVEGQGFIELLDNVYSTGETFIGNETPITLTRNGKLKQFFLNFSYQANKDENGEIDGILAFAYDVTEHVNARKVIEANEHAIQKAASNLKLATDSANLGTWSLDVNSQKLEWNELHKKMWGYDEQRDNFVYEDWHKIIDAGDKEKVFKTIEDVKANQAVYNMDYCINRVNDGALRCMRSIGKYYYNDDGTAETFTGISIDVTEQKESEQKLNASEEKYRGIIETMDQGFCIIEVIFDDDNNPVDYRFIETNPMFEKQTGMKDVIGKRMKELVPNIEKQWYINYGNVALTGEATRFMEVSEAMGRWFEVYTFRLGGEGSKKVAVLFSDITESKQAHEKIKASEEQFRNFANSIQNLAWIANGEGWIYWYNQQWYDYTGTSLEEMEGWGWEKVQHPDHREKVVTFVKEAWKKNEAFELTYPLRRHDGTYRWFLTRVYPIIDASGTIERWIGTNTDITEQKNFSETLETKVKERTLELYEKNLKLEQTNAELISFSYISSHDLQEPLRKIQMFSSRIIETETDTLSDNALNYLERMQQAAYRMQNLIQDLIAYSRTNVKETKFEKADLNLIIEDVKETLSEELEQKNVTFKLNNVCDIKIIPIQFTQVILNLVSNSIKFTKEDQPVVIEIECEEVKGRKTGIQELASQQDYTHIRVSDNGIGFEPLYNEKIFEVFQRLHGREAYTGTGIGLAIVKRIIENHNGVIRANGKLNEGATFDIYIPAH